MTAPDPRAAAHPSIASPPAHPPADGAVPAVPAVPAVRAGGPATAAAAAVDPDAAWAALHAAACAPYRPAGRFAWHFARGKLGRDPVFRGLLARGDLPARARIVDIGCGQGLLASLLAAVDAAAAAGRWPAAWPPAPVGARVHGIELMARDVARARAALGALPEPPQFVCADMREAPLPRCDAVVILDVLHYVDHAAQAALLRRVHAALVPGGRLLLRVGDQDARRGFAVSQWVDRVVTAVRGHRVPPTWGRPLRDWTALLEGLGFRVAAVPMSAGTPFANVLLVADRRPDAPGPGMRSEDHPGSAGRASAAIPEDPPR
ncbi:class I SAM-dependent methyltransferase [Piscinibacter sakaiensis]|uniref:SAM-dependent methyltransferases n=1 Tax=Piscinibacter sakaiensis TaxID=1547922 RepID=A0A0K8P3V7_PISS1|nr:class I SAM-dependent methyltransferase [Piscinibacter sakaiensis]GAP37297.1 SAM-dependent methyltransferases [Piscinibacter sakaiensis]